MLIKNTQISFGLISKSLHWIMAILLTGLFLVGLYMTDLNYNDALYHTLPWWHKSVGLLVLFLLLARVFWISINPAPRALKTHKKWEVFLAHLIQKIFYLLIFLITISGYFISTAEGDGIEFFSFFEVPAIINNIDGSTVDFIGKAHEIIAITLAALVILHAFAALKHHFIDKDETLKRMLGGS